MTMALSRPARKILFLNGSLGSKSLRVNLTGGVDVCGEFGEIYFSLTRAERENWVKHLDVAGPIWDILSDASLRNFFEPGEIVTPYKFLVYEDATSEVYVRIDCTNDDTCLQTYKKTSNRREVFVVHDKEKSALIDWLRMNFV